VVLEQMEELTEQEAEYGWYICLKCKEKEHLSEWAETLCVGSIVYCARCIANKHTTPNGSATVEYCICRHSWCFPQLDAQVTVPWYCHKHELFQRKKRELKEKRNGK